MSSTKLEDQMRPQWRQEALDLPNDRLLADRDNPLLRTTWRSICRVELERRTRQQEDPK